MIKTLLFSWFKNKNENNFATKRKMQKALNTQNNIIDM